MKKIRRKIIDFIYDYIYIPVFFNLMYVRDLRKIKLIYGSFEKLSRGDQKKYFLWYKNELRNVCGALVPEIVKMILDLKLDPGRILLDGDDKSVVGQFKKRFNFQKAEIITIGEKGNYDFNWNFENDPPVELNGDFDLIISQAVFEHLVDPYKHFRDLAKLLKSSGGYLLIHTHIPGYTYHRYPIDAVRFFPDWFGRAADKNGLIIKRKFLRNFHIIYLFEKR
jgi:SAM-dependent methyltransferase